jgi:hypothetical protein
MNRAFRKHDLVSSDQILDLCRMSAPVLGDLHFQRRFPGDQSQTVIRVCQQYA